jgi:hypothetical protein
MAGRSATPLWQWVQANHRNNCLLWAEEDLARRTTVADADIAANKRAIDGYNQASNDATERVDEYAADLAGLVDAATARTDATVSTVPAGARLNSETAGSMMDRMSIMSLKVKAMRQQTVRTDVDEAHRAASRVKLARLHEQRQIWARAWTRCWPTAAPAAPTSRSTGSSRCTTTRASTRRWWLSGKGGPGPREAADRQDHVDGRRGACHAGRGRPAAGHCPAPRSTGWWRPFAAIPRCTRACAGCCRWPGASGARSCSTAATWRRHGSLARRSAAGSATTWCWTCRACSRARCGRGRPSARWPAMTGPACANRRRPGSTSAPPACRDNCMPWNAAVAGGGAPGLCPARHAARLRAAAPRPTITWAAPTRLRRAHSQCQPARKAVARSALGGRGPAPAGMRLDPWCCGAATAEQTLAERIAADCDGDVPPFLKCG